MQLSYAFVVDRKSMPVLLFIAALALGGCQSRQARLDADPMATSSTDNAATGLTQSEAGSFRRAQALSQQWTAKPGDQTIGMEYAASLAQMGQTNTQIEVLKAVALAHPNDGPLQAKLGKQLLSAGRAGEAITMLERAANLPGVDWKTLSALGTAYDQQSSYKMAREKYQAALALKPGELSVQNNMAMSFALEGKLPDAEKLLRAALAEPGAASQPRIQQNLALVVGLQGRFDEARSIASADLPPDQVEANLAFLQQMLAKPNTWAQLSAGNKS